MADESKGCSKGSEKTANNHKIVLRNWNRSIL
nr:MAG TPA: hypothetical protein [Caudoviricetes sp.]